MASTLDRRCGRLANARTDATALAGRLLTGGGGGGGSAEQLSELGVALEHRRSDGGEDGEFRGVRLELDRLNDGWVGGNVVQFGGCLKSNEKRFAFTD